jgi:hypothetical protein
MIIFKNIAQVKDVVAASSISNSIEKLEPHFNEALNEIVIPVIGEDVVQALSTFIENDGAEGDPEYKAAKHLQTAVGNLAFMIMGMDGGVQVDDGGFHRQDDQQTKSAYQWQMNDFRKSRESAGWGGLRNLYLELEKNWEEAWAEPWALSEERAYMKSFFVETDQVFSSYLTITGFQTWWSMRNHMMAIQEETIKSLITEDVYTDLMIDLLINDPSPDDAELINLCRKTVAAGTIFRAVPLMPFKFDKGGLIITEFMPSKDNSAQQTQATAFINKLHGSSIKLYTEAKNQLAAYLDANASDSKYISYYEEKILAKIEEKKTIEDLRDQNKNSKVVLL